MKFLKILLASILFITVTACGNNDDVVVEDTSSDLVGTWQLTSLDYSGTSTNTIDGIPIEATHAGFAKNIDYSISFSENPNLYDANGEYIIELTTIIDGEGSTLDIELFAFEADGTWSLNQRELTIIRDNETEIISITNLNETTLTIVSDVSDRVQFATGMPANAISTATYVRQ